MTWRTTSARCTWYDSLCMADSDDAIARRSASVPNQGNAWLTETLDKLRTDPGLRPEDVLGERERRIRQGPGLRSARLGRPRFQERGPHARVAIECFADERGPAPGRRGSRSSPWINAREHRERRGAALARRLERRIAGLFVRKATTSGAPRTWTVKTT